MAKGRRNFRNATLAAMALWIVLIPLYVSTNWYVYALYHRPAPTSERLSNNLWLAGGRIAWSRYDASASGYKDPRPPGLSTRVEFVPNGSWFWKTYARAQHGGWFIGVPLWIPLAALTVAGPAPIACARVRAATRRRRTARGRCPGCAYDLAGLTTCPECGHPHA